MSQRAPLKITPSIPALSASFSMELLYCSSSAAPESFFSAFHPSSSGTIGFWLYGGSVSWSAIFRKSSIVNCSTYSTQERPACCKTPA